MTFPPWVARDPNTLISSQAHHFVLLQLPHFKQWHFPSTTLPFQVFTSLAAKDTLVSAVVVVAPYSCAAHSQSSSGATLVASVLASSTKSLAAGGQIGMSQVSFSWSGEGSMV